MFHPDVSIQPPDELDLATLRGCGLQAGEEELPEVQAGDATAAGMPCPRSCQGGWVKV